jgi:hypothetical protein
MFPFRDLVYVHLGFFGDPDVRKMGFERPRALRVWPDYRSLLTLMKISCVLQNMILIIVGNLIGLIFLILGQLCLTLKGLASFFV